jgi:transcription antitermination factor NusG
MCGGMCRAKSFVSYIERGCGSCGGSVGKHSRHSPKMKIESNSGPISLDQGGEAKLPWFALQVRARQEASVGEQLKSQGYERFLPFYKLRKRWSDRIKEIEAPLFPGYLFCRFNPHNRLPILKTPGIIQIVGFNNVPAMVDENEILSIQRLVLSGIQHQPCPFLAIGDRVRISAGPLLGLEGLLTDIKGSHRLVLSVSLLQRSVAVEIDSAFITPLPRTAVRRSEKVVSDEGAVTVTV